MGVMTERERQKYFAYLDGVADRLNESRNDVNSVLDKIRSEIADLADADAYGDYQQGFSSGLMKAVQIIDKYKASPTVSESEDVRTEIFHGLTFKDTGKTVGEHLQEGRNE